MIFTLYQADQAHGLLKQIWPKVKDGLLTGKRFRLEIKEAKRSVEQNDKFHAIISDIAKSMATVGSKWSTDDWKRLLIDQWAHETGRKIGKVAPSLDGERVVQLGLQSHKFTIEDGSEFIEWLLAWSANKGIEVA